MALKMISNLQWHYRQRVSARALRHAEKALARCSAALCKQYKDGDPADWIATALIELDPKTKLRAGERSPEIEAEIMAILGKVVYQIHMQGADGGRKAGV